ncbi:MAG: hypothetical protein AB1894_20015 [Chloroflexota bacterium]
MALSGHDLATIELIDMSTPLPLQFGKYYHIYSRGNNRENLFVEERNYPYFMALYAKYIGLVADTYAYCLLRNHFHFLVRIKDFGELRGLNPRQRANPDGLPSRQFSNLFNAYARALNRAYGRSGALFQRPFGRVEVVSQAHLLQLVAYIHRNPQKHGFVDDFRDWPYSSYAALMASGPTRLMRADVLAWLGGEQGFIDFHQATVNEGQIRELAPED